MLKFLVVLLIALAAGCAEQAPPQNTTRVATGDAPDNAARTSPATSVPRPVAPAEETAEAPAESVERPAVPAPLAQEKVKETPQQAPEAQSGQELAPRRQLDLSAPTTLDFLGEPLATEPSSKSGFDPKPLFKADDPDNFSLSLAPSFAEPEGEEQTLPTVDGGSVSIEVQTP